MKIINWKSHLLVTILLLVSSVSAFAQSSDSDEEELRKRRHLLEAELQEIAVVDRKVMVKMRDGKRMAADIYRPKDAAARYPTIFSRTPYNFNFWDVRNRAPRDMSNVIEAVKRGYAYVVMNERGHFFSEGNYDILGPPLTDGEDAIEWISSQDWSNGKVGLIGCSSTAEWQMAVAAKAPKGLATIIPQGFGAGVGRVGPYFEQGNWYRGGAVQMLFIAWLYGQVNQVRPMMPADATQEELINASRMFDLAPQMPPVDWSKALAHLPVQDIHKAVDAPKGIFADRMPVPTGGEMIKRAPNDPEWYRGGLFHDNMRIDVPGFWFVSWYDVSAGPNLATYNHVRRTADPEVRDKQYLIIAPTLHCGFRRATEDTVVGERSMGDARLEYDEMTYGWFDHFLKGEDNGILEKMPKVRYFTMGMNKWQSSETWPPSGAEPMTFYLASGGRANSLNGDGTLTSQPPGSDSPDTFRYDPMNPVPSYGGNVCCTGNAVRGGALDQREMEKRNDILVYTSEPLEEGIELSGPIDVKLFVSSDVKDTDFTVKLIDVYPDGTAYNLDETIQRMRYRNGYDKPLAWMENGKVYGFSFSPMNTSNYFKAGHRIRIEISSSNFPRFDRNLNTGGNNYDESKGVVATNKVHHSREYPSSVTISVVRK
ncbi:MAG: CocE/NonD family hydrolase [Acidobacteria bacterium]|nr:MAG: CocE/NonD family hydrolase [Acidobacteriota bacterium]REK03955.1 MAG: CocE/NonD family hydrolase [Acidobacteriota bacterium]REK15117.1 MAG: CocE/NonD family hydrolase [Acidobacteriota bacterium]REK46207.1 MAG: CocE/NonD family hydrolase [Acidobacteriota bacterium]